MIIQVRGTSGSGKSTVMRTVMNSFGPGYPRWRPEVEVGRKKPLYYIRKNRLTQRTILVLGHYESPCGGCDTIGSAKEVFDLIQRLVIQYYEEGWKLIVLCEGLLLSEDVKWTSQLSSPKVLFLTTPLETCLKQIEGRRREAGNEKPLNPKNTENRIATIERARIKLIDAGITCRRASAAQAPSIILGWING